jgi:hypothetical protein
MFLPYVNNIEKYLELQLQTSQGKYASSCIIVMWDDPLAKNKKLLQRKGRVLVWWERRHINIQQTLYRPIDFHTKGSQMLPEINHTNKQT